MPHVINDEFRKRLDRLACKTARAAAGDTSHCCSAEALKRSRRPRSRPSPAPAPALTCRSCACVAAVAPTARPPTST